MDGIDVVIQLPHNQQINTAYSASFVLVNNSSISYQGDGTSGIYIWGAKLEQGNISSYIPPLKLISYT